MLVGLLKKNVRQIFTNVHRFVNIQCFIILIMLHFFKLELIV